VGAYHLTALANNQSGPCDVSLTAAPLRVVPAYRHRNRRT
jgi:hypothetical protein